MLQDIPLEAWEGGVLYVGEIILLTFVLIAGVSVIHAGNQDTLVMIVQTTGILIAWLLRFKKDPWRYPSRPNHCICLDLHQQLIMGQISMQRPPVTINHQEHTQTTRRSLEEGTGLEYLI